MIINVLSGPFMPEVELESTYTMRPQDIISLQPLESEAGGEVTARLASL